VLNAAWTGIFFRARQPGLGTAGNAALLASTVALIHYTRQNFRLAALTLIPYAAWLAFATALSGRHGNSHCVRTRPIKPGPLATMSRINSADARILP